MKRSRQVRRVLLGGLTVGAIAATAAAVKAAEPRVTPENYYTNDYALPGAGFYHAPFHAFFPYPYNFYDAQRKMYYYGGQWGAEPHRSVVNISTPTPDAARIAESQRTDVRSTSSGIVPRSGFGSTGYSHSSFTS